MKKGFQFTPKNIIKNIDKIGPWSAYGLAVEAIEHYHPSVKRIKDFQKKLEKQVYFSHKRGFSWHDWIIKYQKEVGYYAPKGFNKSAVNEF